MDTMYMKLHITGSENEDPSNEAVTRFLAMVEDILDKDETLYVEYPTPHFYNRLEAEIFKRESH